ncbi:threonine--tRNA ligase [Candidatus Uhrbacteria bacterium RIFCSPLOWO2_02_FULL_48_12]|uniref:Threonine--tRNA ligase n=1 Tax=Candidatus Uhrbacteria bacterium RIFCSPLOWO2_02_FULL_48_12 TaxID=1802407 RepID=A0A1F7VAN1_9BACT|nr:MAG: threonine--tRNA ligase [Candidatus Uhrbacteria bacterium RIFCSPLOWO2_02_FULL_48_12]
MSVFKPSNLETTRHSVAHLLAAAVAELYPEAKFGVGPVVENGFYYDLDLPVQLSPDDLPKIEAKMRQIQKQGERFIKKEMSVDEAIVYFKERRQIYKVELLNDIKTKGTTKINAEESYDIDPSTRNVVSVYETGKFADLCRGPHVASTKDIGPFKLTKLAGAYWRGSEKNKMLQRIYGVAFATATELDEYLKLREEAERRDHKKLGPELDLFTFSDLVGSGLPLWTPRGTILRTLLDEFVWELRRARGYERVEIPHLAKQDLYEKSGHWEKFKDELFRIRTREGHDFAVKPMNCPHHTQIYARRAWSYRELPQRYANTTMVYRDEQSGELAGLARVRSITQDDAHVFCRRGQVEDEMEKIWDIIETFYGAVGFDLKVRLSLHDPKEPKKYLGTPTVWREAEAALTTLVKRKRAKATTAVGEAAFYGPKVDFLGKDSLGREHQVATIQLDMNMPERFDLACTNEKSERERIVMIHAAIMGSIERYLAVLIEHFGGAFPVWLSPTQVSVIPVGAGHIKPARQLTSLLREAGLRVDCDEANETVGYKIRKAEKQKVPYMLVIGDKEVPRGNKWGDKTKLSVRSRGRQTLLSITLSQFIDRLNKQISSRQD